MSIPRLGLGTYLIPDVQVTDVILQGFDIGYRHIDTAQIYENERGIGFVPTISPKIASPTTASNSHDPICQTSWTET